MDEPTASTPDGTPASTPANAPASAPGIVDAPGSAHAAATATPAPVARSIGERLLAGRDKTGLTVVAAAEKLHLDPKVIDALEADRFAELGASVYVRGHLKRYAEFVGENATELLNMYGARERGPARPDLTQVPHPERRADPRRLVTPLVVVGSAGVLLTAIWWVLTGTGSGAKSVDASPPRQIVPANASPTAPVGGLEVTPASLTTSAPAMTPAPVPARPVEPAAATPLETAPANAPELPREPPRDTRLRLEMTHDSWVEVYDSRGERLFYDVASAGSVHDVIGRGPLRVVLGNAAGVAVEVDGQARDIPASAVNGEGASFIVNRTGSLSRAR